MNKIVCLGMTAMVMCLLYSGTADISIRMVDRLDFRKSKTDEKEMQMSSNPLLVDEKSETLRKQLERLGFMRGKELIIDKFFYVSKKTFPLTDLVGTRINIRLEKTKEYGDWRMNVIANYDSTGIRLDYGTTELRYVITDIVPGGFSEVIILKEYLIKQEINYDLVVYEIRA